MSDMMDREALERMFIADGIEMAHQLVRSNEDIERARLKQWKRVKPSRLGRKNLSLLLSFMADRDELGFGLEGLLYDSACWWDQFRLERDL